MEALSIGWFVLLSVCVLGSDNFTVLTLATFKFREVIFNINRNFPGVRISLRDKTQKPIKEEKLPDNIYSRKALVDTFNETEKLRCESKYGRRDYKGRWVTEPPPLLLSFPGSGNTWTRLLIEISTGIYTGDIYTDHSLKSVFAGEKSCGKRVSVVKAHPQDLNVSVYGEVYHTLPGTKCQRIGTTYFDKIVIIHRNPFKAFWSEYQRGGNRDRHTKGIPERQFKWNVWNDFAIDNARQFKQAWDEKYHHIFRTFSPSHILVISYERLTSDIWKEREKELRKIVQFLEFPVDKERIKCAFLISFDPKVIRRKSDEDITYEKAFSDHGLRCKSLQIIESMSLHSHERMRNYNLDMSIPMSCEKNVNYR